MSPRSVRNRHQIAQRLPQLRSELHQPALLRRDPIRTMKELHRCLAPQGWLLSQTPSTDGRGAFQDPIHVSFWNSNSFWYYTCADQNRFIDYPVRFPANRQRNFFPSLWHREHQIVYVKADLLKVAGRVPGGVAI